MRLRDIYVLVFKNKLTRLQGWFFMKISKAIKEAYGLALQSRNQAYAPYSQFKVGAALMTKDGLCFTGCNIENASYGGAVCAERVAILKAVSEGKNQFTDIVVVTETETPAAPCGLCLQTMAEFFAPGTRVWLANPQGIKKMLKYSELLPMPFGPRQLKAKRS